MTLIPDNIQSLMGRCENGESDFTNADMRVALRFAESLIDAIDSHPAPEPVTADGLRAMGGVQLHGTTIYDFTVAVNRRLRVFAHSGEMTLLVATFREIRALACLGHARNLNDVRQLVDVLKRIGGAAP